MPKKKNSQKNTEFPFDLENLFSPKYFSKLPEWQQEVVSFYTRRLASYSAIQNQLGKCRTPQDVFELQSDFFTKLLSDYRDEATVMSELLFDVSKDVVEKTQEATEATISQAQKDAEKILHLAENQAETIIEAAEARADAIVKNFKKTKKVA